LRLPDLCETINSIVADRSTKRKRATLRDLAAATGLSQAGVSYALRGQRVSPETEARVRAEAARIGFRSDPIARALRGGSTGLVGMIGGSLEDFWHQEFASELQRSLRGHGRHMLLADAGGDAAAEIELAESLTDQRVDGLVALPVDPGSPRWLPVVGSLPTVAVGVPLPPPAGAIRFASDAGIRLVIDHLRASGHRRILVLTPGPHRPPRSAGVRTVRCGFSTADGRTAARRALDREGAPTAVFALSDALAYGAYMACADLGLDIPGDVVVAGFDDHPLSALVAPPLTSVSWDTAAAAAAAASMLISAIDDGRRMGEVVVPPRLRPRRSTAAQPRT
jgi:LacI family transcriptional regulator